MRIVMIAAMAQGRVIGVNNTMPWHLPADLKHFKRVTMGKPVIMGRKTYQSIGKALPGRENVVISASGFTAEDATVVASPKEALAKTAMAGEVSVIGGGKIYEMFLPLASEIHLTFIDLQVAGDTHFPDMDDSWLEICSQSHPADELNPYAYRFATFRRQESC